MNHEGHDHTETEEKDVDRDVHHETPPPLRSKLKTKGLRERLCLLSINRQQFTLTRHVLLESFSKL